MIAQKTPNNHENQPCPDFMALPVSTGGLHETWFNPVTEQLETFIVVPRVNGSLPESLHFSVPVARPATGQEDRLYTKPHTPKLRELAATIEQISNADEIKITTIDSDDINNALATLSGWKPEPAQKHLTRNRNTAVLLLIVAALLSLLFLRGS